MISPEIIENEVSKNLQKKVDFVIEKKVIKSGKILLFSIKDFYCNFLLYVEEKKKKVLFEIPYPYSYQQTDSGLIFDYTIDTFFKNNPHMPECMSMFRGTKTSKLFNKKLILKIYI